jgi:hypothetical protein
MIPSTPTKWKKLASDPSMAGIKTELANWLPKAEVHMAPGRKQRILSYDPATHAAVWEGKVIDPTEER